jgi:uncharacterized protein YpiB (UPF0302 family)
MLKPIKMKTRDGKQMLVYLYTVDQTVHVVKTVQEIDEYRNSTGEKNVLERSF